MWYQKQSRPMRTAFPEMFQKLPRRRGRARAHALTLDLVLDNRVQCRVVALCRTGVIALLHLRSEGIDGDAADCRSDVDRCLHSDGNLADIDVDVLCDVRLFAPVPNVRCADLSSIGRSIGTSDQSAS